MSTPPWLDQLLSAYKAAENHAFLVTGNIYDYANGSSRFAAEYLSTVFARYALARYVLGQGIDFPNNPEDRRRFDAALGGDNVEDEATALLRGSNPKQAGGLPTASAQAIPLLLDFIKVYSLMGGDTEKTRHCALIEDVDLVLAAPDPNTAPEAKNALANMLGRIGTDRTVDANNGLLIMTAKDLGAVHPRIKAPESGVKIIEIPAPDYERRLEYLTKLVAEHEVTCEQGLEQIAAATAGLTGRNQENLVLAAVYSGKQLTTQLVKEKKREMIRAAYGGVIETMDPEYGLEAVGGHELAKQYVREWVIEPMRSTEARVKKRIPKALLLSGPSGTGKTWFATSLAKDIGYNAGTLGQLKGGIVGETEANWRLLVSGAKAMAPLMLFIDEIDQKFRRGEANAGDGGSAVESNLFGGLLEFLGDEWIRGRILIVAATNRPDLVDAALLRPGRFDLKIPLLPPVDAAERLQVLDALLDRHWPEARIGDNPLLQTYTTVSERTDGWTQAELERLVLKAQGLADIKGLTPAEAYLRALDTLRPATREIEEMTRSALAACDDADLVPERYRALVGQAGQTKVASAPEQRGPRAAREVPL